MSDEPKPKSNAVLKNLPEDRQAQIYEWATKPNDIDPATKRAVPKSGGLVYARAQLAADGMAVSLNTLSEFRGWYGRRLRWRSALSASEHQRELMKEFRPEDAKLANDFAEFTLAQLAAESGDVKLYSMIVGAQENRRSNALRERELEAKINGFKARYEQKERELDLAREKFDASMSTELEKAYAALADELKRNPEAAAAFARMRALLPEK